MKLSPEQRATEPNVRIGGMALQNGILLHSPRFWAAAVRGPDGEIRLAFGRKRRLIGAGGDKWPLLRGLLRLVDTFAVLPAVKAKLGSAVLPMEVPRVAAAIAVSTLATAGLRRDRDSVLRQELATAAVSLIPTAVALRESPLKRYHGAEHKSIGEYELSLRGQPEDKARKEHERCGSNLAGPMLVTSLFTNVLLRKMLRRPSPPATLAGGIVSMGIAMEILRWMTRNPGSPLTRVMGAPGYLLQRFITTDEPSADHMEVARTALAEVLRLEGLERVSRV